MIVTDCSPRVQVIDESAVEAEAESDLPCAVTSTEAQLIRFPPEEPTVYQRMRLMESSGVLDFWDRPEEDGYTSADGEPV